MYENLSDLLRQIALGENSVLELKSVEFSGNKVVGPHKDGMADELAAMANTVTGIIRFDEQTVPGTTLSDLNPKLWNRFRTVISPKSDQEFLEKMKLIAQDEDNVMRATVSGILLASNAPESFMPNAFN